MTEKFQPCTFIDVCCDPCAWCRTHDYSEACVPMLQHRIQELEARDTVEVVRCVDCKFTAGRESIFWKDRLCCTRDGKGTYVKPNDFCSCGERAKKNETDFR